jgi:hypothetical protein
MVYIAGTYIEDPGIIIDMIADLVALAVRYSQ